MEALEIMLTSGAEISYAILFVAMLLHIIKKRLLI